MIQLFGYFSDEKVCEHFLNVTGLALDELEYIVGRYKNNSSRAGRLRGKFVLNSNGEYEIRHHFTNKLLWSF